MKYRMNYVTLTTMIFLPFILLNCSHEDSSINIAGSDTLLELTQLQAEDFFKDKKRAINLTGGGSGVGITMLLDKQTDIANLSRNINPIEITQAKKLGIKIQVVPIAIDMLTVIVNKDNKVDSLSHEQLRDIYLGKIKNWKELKGDNIPISLYGRQSSSGTYQFFQETILSKKDFSENIYEMTGNPQMISSLQIDKGGIAYIGLGYALRRKNDIKIIIYDGFNPVNILNTPNQEKYPLSRYLYQVINMNKYNPSLDEWFEYILSEKGDKLIKEGDFLPLPKKQKKYIKTSKGRS